MGFIEMARAKNKPFYVNSWFHVSHAMLTPTEDQLLEIPFETACRLAGTSSGQTTCAHQIFWAAQQATDASIGRLLSWLRGQRLWTETLIVFVSAGEYAP